jgi:glyoxylase-like metal-dependent hydrolase (beta-lactamase superfamily II)
MVCHVLLIETARAGLVLVETGLGTPDVARPGGRLPRSFRAVTGAALDPAETALAHVARLGFDPHDVRHIVVTHLDLDHAGGISDFPWATVHLHARELAGARERASFGDRHRYLVAQIDGHAGWAAYDEATGEPWFGLPAVRPLAGLDDEVALIPLLGHSRGHSGVALRRADGVWLLHAGDSYFHHNELTEPSGHPRMLRAFQRIVDHDVATRRATADQLRQLARSEPTAVRIFCAHDPSELAELAAA